MRYLRQYWGIEDSVFYVRNVGMDEGCLRDRRSGHRLSRIRDAALNPLRTSEAPYIPDARRILVARVDMGLSLLLC
ncbi:MAG: hypothetical protein N2508_09440 [Anaerolineae bacterium]|nr:hypothetical protein [Anaerolineae bacterium]